MSFKDRPFLKCVLCKLSFGCHWHRLQSFLFFHHTLHDTSISYTQNLYTQECCLNVVLEWRLCSNKRTTTRKVQNYKQLIGCCLLQVWQRSFLFLPCEHRLLFYMAFIWHLKQKNYVTDKLTRSTSKQTSYTTDNFRIFGRILSRSWKILLQSLTILKDPN